MVPMPEEPPWINSVSPGFSAPRSNTLCHTVIRVSGTAPASRIGNDGGTAIAWASCAMQYWAYPPPATSDITLSPSLCLSAPEPSATTSPEISRPGRSLAPGGGGYAPERCATSGRLTPAAATLTRISPGPGEGTARVSGNSTSGPPGLLMPITVICAGSFSMICPCECGSFAEHLISQPGRRWQPPPERRTERGADGHRGRRQAKEESHPRGRAGPVAAVGRGIIRAHRADEFGDRAPASRHGEEARVKGCGEQLLQVVSRRDASSRPPGARDARPVHACPRPMADMANES